MILVVEFTQHHDALGALFAGEEMEVEQYHLALEVGETAYLSLVVLKCKFDASVYAHLAGLNLLLCHLVLDDADVLHSLDGDIVEVLATLSARIVGIPTGCYGSKYLHVVFVVARVEDKCIHIAQLYRLEERIVSVCLHWLLEDVVGLDVLFVSLEHAAYDGFDRIVADVRIFHEPVDIALESHLLKRQLFDLVAVFRTFHFVFEAHLRISRLYLDGFCRIDGKIDGLVGDA